jgi:sulfur-oxidizing protein SoxA
MRGRVILALLALALCGGGQRSGYHDMGPETRAMQDDDAANPAFLWVAQGKALWSEPAGLAGRSCAACHGPAETALPGVAARYPREDDGRVWLLEDRIRQCRVERQNAPDLDRDSDALLGLTALTGLQSRGLPIAVEAGTATLARGRALFETRMGQLNLACAQCHDQLAGKRLAGSVIPQAHPTGYPQYRLEWQSIGSVERRLRNCLTGVRARPLDAEDTRALLLFLYHRANGMALETPAVRP